MKNSNFVLNLRQYLKKLYIFSMYFKACLSIVI